MPRCTRALTAVLAALLLAGSAEAAKMAPARTIPPSTVVMSVPPGFGALERPAVEFNHAAHTSALAAEGCTTCHVVGETGLVPGYAPLAGASTRGQWMDAAHDGCISCHRAQVGPGGSRGPLTCGGCHVRRPLGVPERLAMAFDYSLHARHAEAYPEQCETCHHDYDQVAQRLVHFKGAEESCAGCHGARDDGQRLSLRNASHTSCVGCHLGRLDSGSTAGPTLCVGCHDAAVVATHRRLEPTPRLLRGQPDRTWLAAEGAGSAMVAFDHLRHEAQASSCSGCHHQRLKPCRECHTLTGAPAGNMVTLEEAHHRASSELACVGCHAASTAATACVGCHRSIPRRATVQSCVHCHSGPQPAQTDRSALPPPPPADHRLPPLPVFADGFPETVVIDVLASEYQPARLPHGAIVARLDAGVRESPLAVAFHGTTERLCGGCHHHAPEGAFAPRCRSCHGATDAAVVDRPGLLVAYHRQCIGCHQDMGIPQQGCTDCHAAKEVQ